MYFTLVHTCISFAWKRISQLLNFILFRKYDFSELQWHLVRQAGVRPPLHSAIGRQGKTLEFCGIHYCWVTSLFCGIHYCWVISLPPLPFTDTYLHGEPKKYGRRAPFSVGHTRTRRSAQHEVQGLTSILRLPFTASGALTKRKNMACIASLLMFTKCTEVTLYGRISTSANHLYPCFCYLLRSFRSQFSEGPCKITSSQRSLNFEFCLVLTFSSDRFFWHPVSKGEHFILRA